MPVHRGRTPGSDLCVRTCNQNPSVLQLILGLLRNVSLHDLISRCVTTARMAVLVWDSLYDTEGDGQRTFSRGHFIRQYNFDACVLVARATNVMLKSYTKLSEATIVAFSKILRLPFCPTRIRRCCRQSVLTNFQPLTWGLKIVLCLGTTYGVPFSDGCIFFI